MDLPRPIHDILVVFLGSVLVLGGLGVVLLTNPIYSAFSLGFVLISISLFYISLNSYFVAAAQLLIYVGAINVLILFAVMHECFRIFQRFLSLDHWRWGYFNGLYNYSFFTNDYYPRYIMVRDSLDYKIKPNYRTGPHK